MSDEANVTYVGGKAIEQTLAAEPENPNDNREDALAAVREAIEKAGKESAEDAKSDRAKDPFKPAVGSAPERGPDGKFLPRDEKPAEKEPETEDFDPEKANVKQLLKNREKLANYKKEAKDELSKAQEAFRQEQARHYQEMQRFQMERQRLQQEREAWTNLRKDPGRAIREAGYEPEQFILDLAREGTPEGQAERQRREFEAQLKEMRDWKEQQAQAQERQLYEAQLAQIRQHRSHAEQTFTNLGMNEEKYPHVAAFYKGREKALISEGDMTAEEFRTLTGGREASLEDILDYIEDQLAERTKSWYAKSKPTQKVESKAAPSGSKGKSLSPDFSGERRALNSKELKDLDGEERHEAAKQAVKVALAASQTNND
jgi:hypothetical protein